MKYAALFLLIFLIWFNFAPQFGSRAKGKNLQKIKKSLNYRNGRFNNTVKTTIRKENTPVIKTIKEYFNGQANRTPSSVIQTVKFDKDAFVKNNKGLFVSWSGHSTVLLNIEGYIVLLDPVFSERISPIPFIGTKCFKYSDPIKAEDLPQIDAVLISHDHYDHLDYETIKKITAIAGRFLVPLGVSAHLEKWGIPENKIIEMDWWESSSVDADKSFTCTPARHFSGRKIIDTYSTLWCSWVINVNGHKIFFSGDSGYGDHFKDIGDKYGPFEITLLECGQYNEDWKYVHELPEQTIMAHNDLKGEKLMPVHWGKFLISLHSWTDPMEKLFFHARGKNIKILTPDIGEIADVGKDITDNLWWKKLKNRR